MDYQDALDSLVSIDDALGELERHGHTAIDFDAEELFDCMTGETIAVIRDGEIRGGEVLAWLGY